MMPKTLDWKQATETTTRHGGKIIAGEWVGTLRGQMRAHITSNFKGDGFIVWIWPCAGASGSCPVASIEDGKAYATRNAIGPSDRRPVYVVTIQGGQVVGIAGDGDGFSGARFIVVDHDIDRMPKATTVKLGRKRVHMVEEIPTTDPKHVARVAAALED